MNYSSEHINQIRSKCYLTRKAISHIRRPCDEEDLAPFHEAISNDSHRHPYHYSSALVEKFQSQPRFLSLGHNAVCTVSESKYLYSIKSVTSLQNSVRWHDAAFGSRQDESFADTLLYMYSQYLASSSNGRWVPLGDFSSGEYSNRRSHSWWTCEECEIDGELSPSQAVVASAMKCGLLLEWVGTVAVVMRRPALNAITVLPTEIEAINSEVFLPQHEGAAAGRAINIAERPMQVGATEYCCPRVPVNDISFAVIDISEARQKYLDLASFPQNGQELVGFYNKIMEEDK